MTKRAICKRSRSYRRRAVSDYVFTMYRVDKFYGADRQVLANISLSFLPGAKIGVLGPNGAGKSTLLRIMAGREEPSSGIAELAPGARVGLLEQEPSLDPEKDVRANVEDGVRATRDLLDRFNQISAAFAEPDADFDALLEEQAKVQDAIDRADAWTLDATLDRAMDALRDCRGIVLDVRGNPGGIAGMVMGVAGYFLDEPKPLGIMRSRGTELRFVANPRRVNARGEPIRPYEQPLAILVDRRSVSTSEIFAAGMQTVGRARIFGDTTAAQALPAVAASLPSGDFLLHVVADFTGPDGRRIEGRGVVPDEPTPLTRADLLAGRDAALDAAVRWIRQGGGAAPAGLPR